MKIVQCHVAKCLSHFEARFRKKYGLTRPYENSGAPAIFFGCYSNYSLIKILNHNGLGVIVWAGGDAKALRKYLLGIKINPQLERQYRKILTKRNIKHIAISKFIEIDLMSVGLLYKKVPVNPTDLSLFTPCPLGDSVYIYGYQEKPEVYNAKLVDKVKQFLPNIKFICAHFDGKSSAPQHEMPNLYKRCFLGLRLTTHDGLPNTVIELGLMGRKVVYNDNLPNTIPWEHSSDIVKTIKKEFELRFENRNDLGNRVLRYINCGEDWLDSRFYT